MKKTSKLIVAAALLAATVSAPAQAMPFDIIPGYRTIPMCDTGIPLPVSWFTLRMPCHVFY